MKTVKFLLAVLLVIGILAIPVSCQYMLWEECRSDHSFLYCMRVLSK